MNWLRMILVLLLIAAGFVAGFGYGRWYGPVSTHEQASQQERKILAYQCPMHPGFKSDKPGDCGICGMRLVPVDAEDHSEQGMEPAAGGAEDPGDMPMGTIRVSAEKQQLIGVEYGEAELASGVHRFRAVGKVSFDETRIARVQTRIEGWIEEVFVDFTGKLVEKGQPLLTLYSPEMLATQQEYLLALKSREIMKSSPLAGSVEQGDSLLAATRKRLQLWDLSDSQIEEITRTQEPLTNITLYAPISGYVTNRNAFPKQRITPETELYTIVDLSRVWIMADVFENEAHMIRMDQPATVTLSYVRGKTLRARVSYVQPQVDPMTRTLKIRLEAENPGMLLKPDMFVDVEFQVGMPARVTVPVEAVLDSGLRRTVFVDRGNGFLEPREVETGEHIGGRVEITSGLRAGERVVTSGNFLIDSESRLKSAAAGMAGHQHGGSPGAPEQPSPLPAGSQQRGGVPGGPKEPPPTKGHQHD